MRRAKKGVDRWVGLKSEEGEVEGGERGGRGGVRGRGVERARGGVS